MVACVWIAWTLPQHTSSTEMTLARSALLRNLVTEQVMTRNRTAKLLGITSSGIGIAGIPLSLVAGSLARSDDPTGMHAVGAILLSGLLIFAFGFTLGVTGTWYNPACRPARFGLLLNGAALTGGLLLVLWARA